MTMMLLRIKCPSQRSESCQLRQLSVDQQSNDDFLHVFRDLENFTDFRPPAWQQLEVRPSIIRELQRQSKDFLLSRAKYYTPDVSSSVLNVIIKLHFLLLHRVMFLMSTWIDTQLVMCRLRLKAWSLPRRAVGSRGRRKPSARLSAAHGSGFRFWKPWAAA
jgi:hypothetical protein